ncbi:ribosome biogenesis GTPase Der [Thermospira aquatica]|uniref:GTPase Der n=1 Tax=Thermospira aquatica TaxID=2828656 RepID=A0AAX3BCJ7_9SPIR|nr:ribosome biogenesis GTPase Der [Thermospira aquatica]URA09996.1 ribosome biogenesis GTPase Der [Thermospira aquatica]
MRKDLPIVAIIGRPNVGKSSLFNLLIGERKSIVDETEGVTRDINMELIQTEYGAFYLYDTAGFLKEGDKFNSLVQKKVKEAIEKTDIILFMVDGRNLHPMDKEIASFLHEQEKEVWVIANKLDNPDMEVLAYEFYTLGFKEIIPFSVVHKRGYATLKEKIEIWAKNHGKSITPIQDEIRVAIVGKPNVGKSQLVNTILGYERSLVSDVAGTTRDALDDIFQWEGKTIRLIDTAGIKKKSRVADDVDYYTQVRTIQAIERSEIVVLLIDAVEGLAHSDKVILDMVAEKRRGLVIAFNKWDLKTTSGKDNTEMMKAYDAYFKQELPEFTYIPLHYISAKTGYKVPQLLHRILEIHEWFHKRIETSELNQWLQTIKEANPYKQASNLRVYYGTQIYEAPPGFLFFINKKEHLRKDYPRFLEKRLREAFGFPGIPLKLIFKEKTRDDKS